MNNWLILVTMAAFVLPLTQLTEAGNDAGTYDSLLKAGATCLQSGKTELAQACDFFEQAIHVNETYPDAYYNMGLVRIEQTNYSEAARWFSLALRKDPQYANSHLALGTTYDQMRLTTKAVMHYRKFLELQPQSPQAVAVKQWLERNGGTNVVIEDEPATDADATAGNAGGGAAGVAECPLPLGERSRWEYEGTVQWYADGRDHTQTISWTTQVMVTYEERHVTASVVKGFPNELAWYQPGQTPQYSVLAVVGSNVHQVWCMSGSEESRDMTFEESVQLAQKLVECPNDKPVEMDEPLLVFPLAKGAKWNDDKNRSDSWYCWHVEQARKMPLACIAGQTVTVYDVAYRCNPSHTVMEIVPGLGIIRYVYSHHGTTAEVDVRLVSFTIRGQAQGEIPSSDCMPVQRDEPLPPVTNMCVVGCSPSGTMKVVREDEGVGAWVVDATTMTNGAFLLDVDRSMSVLFSPDEEWIAVNDDSDYNRSCIRMFRRASGLAYTEQEMCLNVKSSCQDLEVRDDLMRWWYLHALEWSADSTALLFRWDAMKERTSGDPGASATGWLKVLDIRCAAGTCSLEVMNRSAICSSRSPGMPGTNAPAFTDAWEFFQTTTRISPSTMQTDRIVEVVERTPDNRFALLALSGTTQDGRFADRWMCVCDVQRRVYSLDLCDYNRATYVQNKDDTEDDDAQDSEEQDGTDEDGTDEDMADVETTRVPGLTPQSTTVATRVVEFVWPKTEGAHSYLLQVCRNPKLGSDAATIVNSALFGNEHTQRIDLAAIEDSAVGETLYWGVQPRINGGRTSADWLGPVAFKYQPRSLPVPASDVRISIGYNRAEAIADGQSLLRVTATVTDNDGRPVADEQVRFFDDSYMEANDGTILGSEDKWRPGCSYHDAVSSGYLLDDGQCLCNLYTTRTGKDGKAYARYRLPVWRTFMRAKPMALGVWYHVDGGGNPCARTNLWFSPPGHGTVVSVPAAINDPATQFVLLPLDGNGSAAVVFAVCTTHAGSTEHMAVWSWRRGTTNMPELVETSFMQSIRKGEYRHGEIGPFSLSGYVTQVHSSIPVKPSVLTLSLAGHGPAPAGLGLSYALISEMREGSNCWQYHTYGDVPGGTTPTRPHELKNPMHPAVDLTVVRSATNAVQVAVGTSAQRYLDCKDAPWPVTITVKASDGSVVVRNAGTSADFSYG